MTVTASVYVVLGLALLLAAVLPASLARYPVSAPIVLTLVGFLLGLTPLAQGLDVDPVVNRVAVLHVTEATVLVALMGVGLALDRPLSLLRRSSWSRWAPTARLLLVAMPATIAGVALLGWAVLGLAPAAALLVASALAPTDPVLASDVQVEGPTVAEAAGGVEEIDERNEVRFALTSEAGLNDGLAFPFVRAAVVLAGAGVPAAAGVSPAGWVLKNVVLDVVLGVLVGYLVGRSLAAIAFRAPRRSLRLAEQGDPLLVVAALLVSYGASELVGGYGFLAVFTCAMTMRAADPQHGYHEAMYGVVERLERLLTLVVLLILGFATARGLLAALDWRGAVLAVALVLVVRPVCGYASLALRRRTVGAGSLSRREALVVGFFGVRGVGSLFYVAWACSQFAWPQERWLWATVGFTLIVSVLVHGVTATPVLAWVEGHRERAASSRAP